MDLSIIIVSWRVRELLSQCLRSIYANSEGLELEVFVVDNDSQDGTVEMVHNQFPQARLLANKVNQGFAKANNQGIRLARGRYVLVLNPDTRILPSAFRSMFKFMDSHPHYGLAGCKLLNSDETLQPSVRRFPTFWDQFLLLFKVPHLLPNLPVFKKYLARDFDYDEPSEVDQVMGAFFWLRQEVLEKIGLLDEGFWIWFEEVDYCRRLRQAGWKIGYNPDTEIIHHFGQSFRQRLSVDRQKIFNRSLARYFKKHHSRLAWIGIQIARPFSLALEWVYQLISKK